MAPGPTRSTAPGPLGAMANGAELQKQQRAGSPHHLWRQVWLLQTLLRMFLVVGSHKHLGSSQGWHHELEPIASPGGSCDT